MHGKIFVVVFAFSLFMAGCGGGSKNSSLPTPTPQPSATPTPAPSPTPQKPTPTPTPTTTPTPPPSPTPTPPPPPSPTPTPPPPPTPTPTPNPTPTPTPSPIPTPTPTPSSPVVFFAPAGQSDSGVRMQGTGSALYGADSPNGVAAGLVKFDLNGNVLGSWSTGSIAATIHAMTQNAGDIYACGTTGGGMWITSFAKSGVPQPTVNLSQQLSGQHTECWAIAVSGSQLVLGVRTDALICGMAFGSCDGDRVVITDLQGSVLSSFAVGNTPQVKIADVTKMTGIALAPDGSVVVAGDRYNASGNILGSYYSRYSLQGTLLAGPVLASPDVGLLPLFDAGGRLYVASTALNSVTNNSICLARLDSQTLTTLFKPCSNFGNAGAVSVNIATGIIENPAGGVVVTGTLSKLGSTNASQTDGGAWAVDLTKCTATGCGAATLFQKRTNLISGGTVSGWNSGAYANGALFLWGGGSNGNPAAVLAKNP